LHIFPEASTKLPTAAEIQTALQLYEETRKSHTDRIIQTVHAGNRNRRTRVGQAESDEELRARMKNRGDVSWIHEHDVEDAFASAIKRIAQN